MKDPFDGLDPSGGYRLRRTDWPPDSEPDNLLYTRLDIQLVSNQERKSEQDATGFTPLVRFDKPTLADIAEIVRLKELGTAICRYFTTGGSWESLIPFLTEAKKGIPAGVRFEGYNLRSSDVTSAGYYEHVFVHKDGVRAVRWADTVFVDHISLEAVIAHEQSEFATTDEGDAFSSE